MDPIPKKSEDIIVDQSVKKSPVIYYFLAVFSLIVLFGAGLLYLTLQKSSKDNAAVSYQIEKTPQPIQPTTTIEADLQSVDTSLSTTDGDITRLDKDINDESIDLSE